MCDILIHIIDRVSLDKSCFHKVIQERHPSEEKLTQRQFLDRRLYMRKYFRDLNDLIN